MVISTEALCVRHGNHLVLENVDLTIDEREMVTIVGPNGSGKSTLLRALIGAITPSSGHILRSHDLKIGYVPQRLHIDETLPMTVYRFLALPVKRTRSDICAALEQAGVSGIEMQQIMSLSGGQLQRVLLARALLEEPSLLLLDEATQGLDLRGAAGFYQQIDAIRKQTGCAVIMVSHDLHVVMRRNDRVICLNGHICCEGVPSVMRDQSEFKALFALDDDKVLDIQRPHCSPNTSQENERNVG